MHIKCRYWLINLLNWLVWGVRKQWLSTYCRFCQFLEFQYLALGHVHCCSDEWHLVTVSVNFQLLDSYHSTVPCPGDANTGCYVIKYMSSQGMQISYPVTVNQQTERHPRKCLAFCQEAPKTLRWRKGGNNAETEKEKKRKWKQTNTHTHAHTPT